MKTWQANKSLKLLPLLALTFGVLAPMPASASIVEECIGDQCTITFGYTGQTEPFTFPPSATNVRFEALGAQGGKSGGAGGRVTGSFNEVPTILFITVGGAGGSNTFAEGGFNGGGTAGGSAGVEGSGGGASDIRTGIELSSRVVVAGGGGGRGSGLGAGGGAGGGLVGVSGRTGQATGGSGGSQIAGGVGGVPNGDGTPGTEGQLGIGGSGGSGPLHGGGGGGGGYYGGGGGGPDADHCCADAGGGGGGSSYTDTALISEVVHTQGVRPGAGQITISYQLAGVIDPIPPTEEPTAPPTDESTVAPENPISPPAEEKPPTSVDTEPVPSDLVPADPAPLPAKPTPQIAAQKTTGGVSSKSKMIDSTLTTEAPSESGVSQNPSGIEILQQPSKLRQAAQSVVVPIQKKSEPWNSNTLFAGLVGLAVFALIAGIVVARRGVPGVIAS
jgi:hypothetical protein